MAFRKNYIDCIKAELYQPVKNGGFYALFSIDIGFYFLHGNKCNG